MMILEWASEQNTRLIFIKHNKILSCFCERACKHYIIKQISLESGFFRGDSERAENFAYLENYSRGREKMRKRKIQTSKRINSWKQKFYIVYICHICTISSSVFFQVIKKLGNIHCSYLLTAFFDSLQSKNDNRHWKERKKFLLRKDEISLKAFSPSHQELSPSSFLRMKICRAFAVCVSEKDNKYRKVFFLLFNPPLYLRPLVQHIETTQFVYLYQVTLHA